MSVPFCSEHCRPAAERGHVPYASAKTQGIESSKRLQYRAVIALWVDLLPAGFWDCSLNDDAYLSRGLLGSDVLWWTSVRHGDELVGDYPTPIARGPRSRRRCQPDIRPPYMPALGRFDVALSPTEMTVVQLSRRAKTGRSGTLQSGGRRLSRRSPSNSAWRRSP